MTKINNPTSGCVEAGEWAGFELFPQLLASLFVTANKRNTPDAPEERPSKEQILSVQTTKTRRSVEAEDEAVRRRAAPLCADVREDAVLTLVFTFKSSSDDMLRSVAADLIRNQWSVQCLESLPSSLPAQLLND